jgi:hypothetical protein
VERRAPVEGRREVIAAVYARAAAVWDLCEVRLTWGFGT